MEAPFTEIEKRFVVAEAIKTSEIPLQKLLEVLQYGKIQPQWSEMLLPPGRNLRSCIDAFDELLHAASTKPSTEPTAAIKRKTSDVLDATTDPSRKRQHSGLETIAIARNIQPKPAANGSFLSTPPATVPKKRGRPSKADIEARQAEAAARGETLPEPKSKGGRKSAGAVETGGPLMVAPMTAAFQGPKPEQKSESPLEGEGTDASVKKKRGRPSSNKSKASPIGEGTFEEASPLPPAESSKEPEIANTDVAMPDDAGAEIQNTPGGEVAGAVSQRSDI